MERKSKPFAFPCQGGDYTAAETFTRFGTDCTYTVDCRGNQPFLAGFSSEAKGTVRAVLHGDWLTDLEASEFGNCTYVSTTGSTAVSDTDNDVLKNIPERNFGGYKFKVLSRAGSQYTLDFFDDGTTSEPVNEAVYRRNAYLQDRYGFEVVLYTVDSSDESAHSDELKRSITAQDGQYDLGLIHTIAAGTLAADGDLYNWNDIPVLDFTQPWWSDSIIECLEVGKALYMATNSTSLHSMEYAWGMVFNKDLAADMQVGEDFYGLVRSGEWTIDKLYSVTRKISDDIDGELGMGKNDRYGMGINWWGGTIALMYGMGQKVCERDSDGYPVLNFNTPKGAYDPYRFRKDRRSPPRDRIRQPPYDVFPGESYHVQRYTGSRSLPGRYEQTDVLLRDTFRVRMADKVYGGALRSRSRETGESGDRRSRAYDDGKRRAYTRSARWG